MVGSVYQANVIANYLSKISGIKWFCIREDEIKNEVFGLPPNALREVFSFDLLEKARGILAEVEVEGQRLRSVTLNVDDGVLKLASLNNRVIIIKCDSRIDQEMERIIALLHTLRDVKCSVCGLDLKLAFDRCPSCLSILPFISQRCPYCGQNLAVKKCPKCNTSIYPDGSKAPLFFKRSYARFRRIEL